MVQALQIPNPKSLFIDPKTGLISKDWFIYLSNLASTIGAGTVGTVTSVLHGAGSGFSQIDLGNDVTQVLPGVNGGTSVANLFSITLGGNLQLSGSSPLVISVTASSTVNMPASGTLATLSNIGSVGFQSSSDINISGGTVSNVTVKAVQLITTSTLSINNTASTGGTSAIFTGNKPGGSTTPDKWLRIVVDGSVRYIPCWP